MPTWLVVVLGLAVIAAIYLTTPGGRRLRARLPVPGLQTGRAPREDREYLLRVCDGDAERVQRLLDFERRHDPEMSEAQAYRKAIRTYLRDKR